EAAAESAHRCRLVSLALVTGSVLAFMALWNTVSWSWGHIRQKRLGDAVDYWGATNSSEHASAREFVQKKWQKGDLYGTTAGTNFLEHLQKMRDAADDLNAKETRFVRVAFFGVGFDVNDLALFSGLGFSILLMTLAFSL